MLANHKPRSARTIEPGIGPDLSGRAVVGAAAELNPEGKAINRVTDERAENNWSLCVLSAGAADANTVARAALYVQSVLRRDYDLIDRTALHLPDELSARRILPSPSTSGKFRSSATSKGYLATFDKAIEARLLNGLDMDKHSLAAAVVGLNETIALALVKPSHSPAGHPDRSPREVTAAIVNSVTSCGTTLKG